MKICTNCGQRLGNKQPGMGATWSIGVCDYCNTRTYVTEPRDFGILPKEDQKSVDYLMNLFNIK